MCLGKNYSYWVLCRYLLYEGDLKMTAQYPKVSIPLEPPTKLISRLGPDNVHDYRTKFMRDKDIILYSKSFRRLSGKTQVFLTGSDDHMRTRLTHTLEVAQIARTVATALKLNGDLTDAISLGHDLGHTPFGHVGERTLNFIMNGCESFSNSVLPDKKGFKHNLQSTRIATELESKHSPEPFNCGLNLTNFTLFGMRHHSSPNWFKYDKEGKLKSCKFSQILPKDIVCDINNPSKVCLNEGKLEVNFYPDVKTEPYCLPDTYNPAWSFEAQIVAMSDEIAQRHHDLEDGLEAKLLNHDEVIELLFPFSDGGTSHNFKRMDADRNTIYFSTSMSRFIVNMLVTELIEASSYNMESFIKSNGIDKDITIFEQIFPKLDVLTAEKVINFRDSFVPVHQYLEEYLKNRILNSFEVQRMDGKGRFIIRKLFKAYLANPQQLRDKTIISLYEQYSSNVPKGLNFTNNDNRARSIGVLRNFLDTNRASYSTDDHFKTYLLRTICDYISGMTDAFAIQEYHRLYG